MKKSKLQQIIKEEIKSVLMEEPSIMHEGVGDLVKVTKSKSRYFKEDFSKYIGWEGKIMSYFGRTASIKITSALMKGYTYSFPVDVIQTI